MSTIFCLANSLLRWRRQLLHDSLGAGGLSSVAVLPAQRLSRALPTVAAALIAVMVQPALGQGGATMSAGQSMQNSANSAAGQANRNAGSAVPPSSSPDISTPPADPSGLEGYSGTEPYSADYPGYGYESSAPGGAARGRGGFAPGALVGAAGAGVAGSLGEFFNRPLSAAESFQPTIYEQAALAAHRGDQRLALALFHAHLLAERSSAADALSSVRFSPMLRRPVWALRLGVSINTKTPADLADDPQPIRDGEKKAGERSQSDYASGAGYGYESSGMEAPGAQPPAARRPPTRATPGSPSAQPSPAVAGSLDEMSASSALAPGTEGQSPGFQLPEQPAAGQSVDAGGVDTAAVEELLDRDLGLVAEMMKAELSRRIRDGKFGPALAELTTQGAALAAKSPETASGSDALPMWIPGVEFVGSGIATQVIEKARANQVDLLVHFEVIAKPIPRSEESQYLARCRVVNVATGDTLGASKLLDRREITLAARRSNVRAVVEELLQPAVTALDAKSSVVAMPTLTAQQAVARIATLLSAPTADRMVNLAEIAMFHHLGLIDEDQLQQAVFYAAGDDGLLLMHADYDQRLEIAKRMVARELGRN